MSGSLRVRKWMLKVIEKCKKVQICVKCKTSEKCKYVDVRILRQKVWEEWCEIFESKKLEDSEM